mmetsp:Transcript_56704/g.88244  ORF Transcript_56704/g.88244 Transcript_56704/m.88244 type:complete len:417 (-) Transcript_56704:126-1376(-)
MSVLPSGDECSSGVALVQNAVRHIEKCVGMSPADMNKRIRIIEATIHDVSQSCNANINPASFRNCQVVARPAIDGLLSVAQRSPKIEARIGALLALACVSFDNLENASVAVTSEIFEPMLSRILRPIVEIREQEAVLALMQLLQAICAVAPEAPALVPILPRVLDLLVGNQEGHPACTSVRIVALEILVSCSLSHQRRAQLLSLLPESVLKVLVDIAEAPTHGTAMVYPLGLLFANLSDLSQSMSGNEDMPVPKDCNGIVQMFWARTGFFSDLHACLEASLNSQSWPPQSGIYHATWKMANTYLRLSVAGFVDELRSALLPLMSIVERRAGDTGILLDAEHARAARSVVKVLRDLANDESSIIQMRSSQKLPQALANMQSEEPAATDLLNVLIGQSSHGQGLLEKALYAENISKPW